MVLTTVARDDASNENPVFVLGIGGLILGILGLLVDRFRCLKGWMRCSRWWQIRLSAPAVTLLAVIKLAATVVAAASGFRGGRIFPAVFVGVALGLMLHEHVPAVPAAITVSCAILGIVLVVTRDGWLSLLWRQSLYPYHIATAALYRHAPGMAVVAGKPMMMVNRRSNSHPR